MRTTISIPEDLAEKARRATKNGSLSAFVRDAVAERLARMERERLALAMEQGYQREAEDPSLDPEWEATEVDGLT
jgi:Arc/MetJ-type ribon-helix-helix transcriptional regulator